MATSLIDADSLLALDVGSANTRALLFDVVEGRYHLIAAGTAPTTSGRPYDDVRLGIQEAITQVQNLTGRVLLAEDQSLIVPSRSEAVGVDQLVLTVSAGGAIKTVCVGVLEDVSLQSARRLASTIYSSVEAELHTSDKRSTEGRINTIIQAHPDLVIMAGGLNNGASRSVEQMLEAVGLAAYLLPPERRFEVLYAGNERLAREVEETLSGITPVHLAHNLRPTLETEQLEPAEEKLLEIYRSIRLRQMPQLNAILSQAAGKSVFYPTAHGFGRIVRILSKIYGGPKGVLGVDLGAAATTTAFAWEGSGRQKVFSDLGLGAPLAKLYSHTHIEKIERWLPKEIPPDEIIDYLYNKMLYPESVPVTEEEVLVEQALAREILRVAIKRTYEDFPKQKHLAKGLLPAFEPILASGGILTKAASPPQALMTLLDGLQPTGVTTFVLDTNQLLAPLGAAADINPILTVQMLSTYHLPVLATVITPTKKLKRLGVPLLRAEVELATGAKKQIEVKSGTIGVIGLHGGQKARLRLQPLHGADIGFGAGRGGTVNVSGSKIGVVIDARGRPIMLHTDPEKRREQISKWLASLSRWA